MMGGQLVTVDEIPEDVLRSELALRERRQAKGLCDYCGYPAGRSIREVIREGKAAGEARFKNVDPMKASDTCKFPNRHNKKP